MALNLPMREEGSSEWDRESGQRKVYRLAEIWDKGRGREREREGCSAGVIRLFTAVLIVFSPRHLPRWHQRRAEIMLWRDFWRERGSFEEREVPIAVLPFHYCLFSLFSYFFFLLLISLLFSVIVFLFLDSIRPCLFSCAL